MNSLINAEATDLDDRKSAEVLFGLDFDPVLLWCFSL